MLRTQKDMRIPSELMPHCPHCGRPMTMNLRADGTFAEDEGWHRAQERYHSFLQTREGKRVLFLELGVGYNTPAIIKFPFWQAVKENPRAVYAWERHTVRRRLHTGQCVLMVISEKCCRIYFRKRGQWPQNLK